MDGKYNRKKFLAENSINSMSAIHCKIHNDDKAIIRVSDCHNSIRLWNEINTPEGRAEMMQKIDTMMQELNAIRTYIQAIY